jgi:hypothetical protein
MVEFSFVMAKLSFLMAAMIGVVAIPGLILDVDPDPNGSKLKPRLRRFKVFVAVVAGLTFLGSAVVIWAHWPLIAMFLLFASAGLV